MGDPEAGQGYASEVTAPGRDLVIAVGGLRLGPGIPPFEFGRTLNNLGVEVVFLRDLKQRWYQSGVEGVATTFSKAVDGVWGRVQELEPRSVSVVASSSGGLFALATAARFPVRHVILFSPQSFIGPRKRRQFGDHRWRRNMADIYLHSAFRSRLWDVDDLPGSFENVTAVFSEGHRLDRSHVEQIPGVQALAYPGDAHGVARSMRDNNDLTSLLESRVVSK